MWSDEFDGPEINRSNWTFDIGGWGWGNGESQYYTDRPENARVENGNLVITLRRESYGGSAYTSARLTTKGLREFQYGRLEARIRVPGGVGTWPAFWMLGSRFNPSSGNPDEQWPNVGEIDIMEHVGRQPTTLINAMHGPGYSGGAGIARWRDTGIDLSQDFHVFGIEWDESGITWTFDGATVSDVRRSAVSGGPWVFDQPFFFLLNVALGGTLGGAIDPGLLLPREMLVDYVRVYQTQAG